jgi:hypothetical protein
MRACDFAARDFCLIWLILNAPVEGVFQMLRSLKDIRGYGILASDGEIGDVYDFYFDDQSWNIRYLVVDTGKWLPGQKVLIAPMAIGEPDATSRLLPVKLTKDQISNSPGIEMHKPVSRQHEIELFEYYGWVPYWPTSITGTVPPPGPTPIAYTLEPEAGDKAVSTEEADPHLRSTREVFGYHIQAHDGHIGHIDDLIFDDEDWVIRYMAVDTRNWLPGRRVLITPDSITEISWEEQMAHANLTCDTIRNGPEYDPSSPVNREYEVRYYDYYGRPKYWL